MASLAGIEDGHRGRDGTVAIDGLSHGSDDPVEPERHLAGRAGAPSRDLPAERDPEKAELQRAVGELASENADLYKRVGDLTDALKMEKAQRAVWSAEVTRDREQTATIIAELQAGIEELRRQLMGKSLGGNGRGERERAIGSGRTYEGEKTERQPRRWTSDAGIATGAAVMGGVLQAFGDWLNTPAAVDTTGLIGWGITIGATAVAWIRELRRDKDEHRP